MADDRKFKILIVDDDAFILNMYVAKFTKEGHIVETARSGAETLAKLKEDRPPDVVLLDVVLPGTDGLDLLAQIRAEKISPATKIIMLTNQGAGEEVQRAQELGVSGYIVKADMTPSQVVAKVMNLLQ